MDAVGESPMHNFVRFEAEVFVAKNYRTTAVVVSRRKLGYTCARVSTLFLKTPAAANFVPASSSSTPSGLRVRGKGTNA